MAAEAPQAWPRAGPRAQYGRFAIPSSAENSMTPQWETFCSRRLEISNSIGYSMRSDAARGARSQRVGPDCTYQAPGWRRSPGARQACPVQTVVG